MTRSGRHVAHAPAVNAAPVVLSVVVPAYNARSTLPRCLRSLRAAGGFEAGREVIVADNGSTDGTADLASAEGARVLVLPHVSVSVLRNEAARAALGRALAFVDADQEVSPQWVSCAAALLQAGEVAAAGHPYTPPPDANPVQLAYDALRRRSNGAVEADWLPSGNLVVDRATFLSLGGFDETLDTCEDVDFCHRLRRGGLRIVSDDRLASMHHGDPATLGGVFFGELWRGRDNLRVSFRRPVSARAIVTAMLPLAQMATMTASAAMALAAPWAGTGLLGGALAAAAIAPTVLRTAVMTRRAAPRGPGPATLAAVAVAYDAGRAAALLVRARHATRRRG